MPSLRARLAIFLLNRLGLWRPWVSEDTLRPYLARLRSKPLAAPVPRRNLAVTKTLREGREIFRIAPGSRRAGKVLYIHGGAYVEPAVGPHWTFIARLAGALGLEFIVPRYPLAPESDVGATMPFMLALYREIIREDAPVIVMGDSAGGGLALALLQEAREQGLVMPAGLVMISPWLDGTMSAPEQARIEPHDVMLRRAGLLAAARWYAGALPLEHRWISPVNGPLEGLPPMLMLGSDCDLLVTDMRHLAERAKSANAPLDYEEVSGLCHTWPLVPLPFPEAAAGRRRIETFVRQRLSES